MFESIHTWFLFRTGILKSLCLNCLGAIGRTKLGFRLQRLLVRQYPYYAFYAVDEVIKEYFSLGYKYKEILAFLETMHEIRMR